MLDHEALLAPVSDADPTGEDMSFSLEFDAIREARRADDPSLEQGEWVTDLKTADWPGVARQCAELLQARSKDLQLAVWWAEAQTRNHGFTGLADGYRLVAGLCDRFWDGVHPRVEDDDLEQRIGYLSWLLAHSAQWLRELPLVQAPQGQFGLADFESARAHRTDDSDNPGPDLDTLEEARRATAHEFYQRLTEVLPDCRAALAELERAVDARLGMDGPSFSALREQLEHVSDIANRFAREAGVLLDGAVDADVADAGTDAAAPAAGAAAATAGNGAITTRKEAIVQLRKVAEFFRRTEPHSPVAYLADKAARWGEMPLHVWLKRVIKDDSTLAQMEELLDVGDSSAE